jgi:hypothetical protein
VDGNSNSVCASEKTHTSVRFQLQTTAVFMHFIDSLHEQQQQLYVRHHLRLIDRAVRHKISRYIT